MPNLDSSSTSNNMVRMALNNHNNNNNTHDTADFDGKILIRLGEHRKGPSSMQSEQDEEELRLSPSKRVIDFF